MASADVFQLNEEQITCPICFEIPDAEIYQCLDGHEICKKCHSQLTECPQCRVPFNASRPIRNRYFERLLESTKITCSLTGCSKRLSKSLIREHENICCFNFEKYGNFVPLCNLIGYTDCSSLANNGNSEEIANHLISIHGCMQSKGNEFCMELLDFQMDIPGQHFWTPVIFNLKDKQCYLLTFAVLNTASESFGLISIYLPYSSNLTGVQEGLVFEFSCFRSILAKKTEKGNDWKYVQAPIPLKKVAETLSSKTLPFQFNWMKSNRNFSSVLITYKIKPSGEEFANEFAGLERVEQIPCAKHLSAVPKQEGIHRWNNFRRSAAAHELFYQKFAVYFSHEGNSTLIIQQILSIEENEQPFPRVLKEDVKWLSLGVLFLTAQLGTFNDLRFLIQKGVNVNVINEKGVLKILGK